MLGFIRRLLGKENDDGAYGPAAARRHPRSATADVLANGPRSQAKKAPAAKPKAARVDDFNPYNTGKFDRSASWEKISRNQR